MASPVEVVLILADSAQIDPLMKAHILGAGWSVAQTPTPLSAVVALVKIPWDRTNVKLPAKFELRDADGTPVEIDGSPVASPEQEVEVGRPPGVFAGASIDFATQVTVPPLALQPGRYTWHFLIAETDAQVSFQVVQPRPS
jgi:hypothetical protein